MSTNRSIPRSLVIHALALGAVAAGAACVPDLGAVMDLPAASSAGDPCDAASYAFTLACDVELQPGAHQCTEHYGNYPTGYPASSSDEATCKALHGTILPGKCPTASTLGACTTTSTTGSYGASTIIFQYEARGATAESFAKSCTKQNSAYRPAGEAPAAPGTTSAKCAPPSSASSGSGFSFSVATNVNGRALECTNYFGATEEATASAVSSAGATRSPCPNDGRVSAVCDIAKGGALGGTRTTLVYYQLPDGAPATFDPGACAAQGGTFATTYAVP